VLKLELHSAPPNAVDHGISTQAINISPLRGVKTVNAFFHSFYRNVVLTSWDRGPSDSVPFLHTFSACVIGCIPRNNPSTSEPAGVRLSFKVTFDGVAGAV
jgi:hypothetical protein